MMTPRLAVNLSVLSYLEPDQAFPAARELGLIGEFFTGDSAQAYIFSDDVRAIVVFRGTEGSKLAKALSGKIPIWKAWQAARDFIADAKTWKVKLPANETWGRVHAGFYGQLKQIWNAIERSLVLKHDHKHWELAGHSLGGGLAHIAALQLLNGRHGHEKYGSLMTFGCPRALDHRAAKTLEEKWPNNHLIRFENALDAVTRVPKIGYRHAGFSRYFDRRGKKHLNPGWLFRFRDRTAARVKLIRQFNFRKLLLDGLRAHSLATQYVSLVSRWYPRIA